jgi:hypothetical protein
MWLLLGGTKIGSHGNKTKQQICGELWPRFSAPQL